MAKISVNFNPSAEYAVHHLALLERRLQQNMERVSSGQNINSAKDDPSGFATRERMRATLATMRQGIKNIQNGVSLAQTAEGALETIVDLLGRMTELATSAASGNVSQEGREKLDAEFQEVAAEIERLSNDTEFNGHKLLDGSLADPGLRIHFGQGNSAGADFLYFRVAGTTLADLGLSSTTLSSQTDAQAALAEIKQALATVNERLGSVGAFQNRLENMQADLSLNLENLQETESVISDADMAEAVVSVTQDQVLRQVAMAQLAQANDLAAQAVSLLFK
ncbi:MAG: flagellin [Deltaproteobacteria bacterium]|nr:flagellin [Deltaproteobacteria bacterium]MBW2071772.1 flagellin [Deltaproteobacteria bacterium]